MKTLGAYMIVKDEESCIATCLNSIINICDEIVIVDTGCSDKTMEIVASFNSPKIKTSTFKWVNDFSAARNYAMRLTTADYVFTTDADEEFTAKLQNSIITLKEKDFNGCDAIELWLLNKNTSISDSKYLGGRTIIRRSDNAIWRYKIHEKLYNKEDSVYTIPFEDGFIFHNHKNSNSTGGYGKYAEIYFNEINGGDIFSSNNKAHFFYYLFFTLQNIDEFTAKIYLPGLFDSDNIIAISEDQRINLLSDNIITKEQFFMLSLYKNLDFKLAKGFLTAYNDDIAEYIILKKVRNNLDNYESERDYILPEFGVLSYQNGRINDFIEAAEEHIKLSPDSTIAKNNINFVNNVIRPVLKNYKLVIDCSDTAHLPSITYYLSQYFYDVYIKNGDDVENKYNMMPFKNIYYINSLDEVDKDVIFVKASDFLEKNKINGFFYDLFFKSNASYEYMKIIKKIS